MDKKFKEFIAEQWDQAFELGRKKGYNEGYKQSTKDRRNILKK